MTKQISPLILLTLTLASCALGPDYQRPSLETPASFKEAPQGWKSAEPGDEKSPGSWWEIFGDSQLNGLMQQVNLSNQNIIAAQAQYRQAQAQFDAAHAAYFPSLSASLSGSRAQTGEISSSSGAPRNTVRLGLNASWEADVWGRIGRTAEASQAAAQASAADLQAAQLSAQALLAQTYVQLRGVDLQRHLLEQSVAAYERSLTITRNRFEAGVAGRIDVAQAETQLKSTQAQFIDMGIQRAQLEHAIAVLLGQPPANFSLPETRVLPVLPQVPLALPAALLERRPDVAAAERRVEAANAQIGVAQAAFFPALTLAATGGYQNSSFSQLLSLPNRFWSLGPALALTLFDGGARSAQKEQALASYDKSVASYRQSVLTAFQEVEDDLVSLRILASEAEVQRAAARAAAEALQITENQYQAGTVSYLNVTSAQSSSLSAERSSLDIASKRLLASVALIKALGGGWSTAKPDLQ